MTHVCNTVSFWLVARTHNDELIFGKDVSCGGCCKYLSVFSALAVHS